MDIQPDSGGETNELPTAAEPAQRLPVHFRRDPANAVGAEAQRGVMQAKLLKAYYLHGLTAVFQPGVLLPDAVSVEQDFSGEEVMLVYPGPNAVEVLELIRRFPGIKCLHIVESCEANIDAIRSELQREVGNRELPELAGYVTDLAHLPEELAGRCGLAVEINVVDPKSDKWFRQEAAREISLVLRLGGLFYSAGETVRWTDGAIPLSLVRIPLETAHLKRSGYSDALPQPVFYLKRSPEGLVTLAEEEALREWWKKGLALIGHPEAARLAWQRTIEFFNRALRA